MGGPDLEQRSQTGRRSSSRSPRSREPGDAEAALPDLQSLLSGAVTRLAEATGSTRTAAWALRPDGGFYVAAAAFPEDSSFAPTAESEQALEPIWQRGIATDLGEPGLPGAVAGLVEGHGFTAAAPLSSSDGRRLAMLLLGGPEDPPGRVRPRCLAALDAAVRRLHTPATAAAAHARLSLLDEKICRLDRLASLGDLLAEVVHEVRNPLVSVKTFLQLLPDHLQDSSFQTDFRQLVMDELARMERLLDTVMEHARPREQVSSAPGRENRSSVDDVLSSIARLLEQRAIEHQVSLETAFEVGLPTASMGRDCLRQVILNLTLNALEATPRDSRVTLRARRAAGDRIELSVEDEGPGVPEELRSHVFEPFFTTRSDRSGGLGLAISKRLVDEAGGSLEVDSAPGGGARFRVVVPAG
jgi:signal transduction histidine kinase